MTEIEITKIQCVWQVWVGGRVTLTCHNQAQAERIAIKFALIEQGVLSLEDV